MASGGLLTFCLLPRTGEQWIPGPEGRVALTMKEVRGAAWSPRGPSTQYLWDTDGEGAGEAVPGFGVRLYRSGRKSYVLGYRTRAGRFRIVALGTTVGMTLTEARKEASRLRGEVDRGDDPLAGRQQAREEARRAVSFRDFCEIYVRRMEKRWTPRTRDEYERRIRKHLKPVFGSTRLEEITRSEVANVLDRIAEGSGPYESNRNHELIRAMFGRASAWGFIPEDRPNPARGIERFREVSRERWLKPEEVTRLIEAVRTYAPGASGVGSARGESTATAGEERAAPDAPSRSPDPLFRAFVPLLLLTGLRKNELLQARWDQIDLKRGEIRLPKTKSGRPQVRKLSGPAVEILRFLPRDAANPFVFPGRKPGTHRRDYRNEWQEVREAVGLQDVTLHDLRRTAGSYMAQAGVSLQTIGDMLGHQNPAITRVYARLSEENERQAVEALGEKLGVIFGGVSPA